MRSFFPRLSIDRKSLGTAAIWVILVATGIAVRVYLLWKYPNYWFDGDEGNLGMMALRLLRRGEFRIFIAGEVYGGFLGVWTIALCTLLVGSPSLGIKIAPMLFF